MNVLSTAACVVDVACPLCGAPVPVTVEVRVVVCDCGRHQAIETVPDLTDVAAHGLLHDADIA